MSSLSKLNTVFLSRKLKNFIYRNFFRMFNKTSNTALILCQDKKYFLQNKPDYSNMEHCVICQKRNFRMSLTLCEDKIVSTPAFPESVTEGDIRWLKAVGDTVNVDEVVCEIETDKTSIPVPAPVAGVIAEAFATDGSAVKAGQQLFRITVGVGAPTVKPAVAPKPAAPSAPHPAKPVTPAAIAGKVPPPPETPVPPIQEIPVPPKAAPPPSRRPIPPAAATKPPQAIQGATVPPDDPSKKITGTRTEYRVKMNRIRQKIAKRLKEAQNTTAMLTTFNELDMSAIIEFVKNNREAFKKKFGLKLSFMSPFIKAATYALQDQPIVNAAIINNEIVYRDYIDISVAMATPKGLVVPVIRNVESMNYADIEKAISFLAKKAKTNTLAVEDMDGGTFTVSNGGVFGSLMSTPIINMPQSAILGMHATFQRPVAIKNQVVIRPIMYIALTYDHRIIDGREAVLFLRKIQAAVEDPRIMLAGL